MKYFFALMSFSLFFFCSDTSQAQNVDTSARQLKTIQKLHFNTAHVFLMVTDTVKDSVITPEYLAQRVQYSFSKKGITVDWNERKADGGTKSSLKYSFDNQFKLLSEEDDAGTEDFETGMFRYDETGKLIMEWWTYRDNGEQRVDSVYYHYDHSGKLIEERDLESYRSVKTDSFYYDTAGHLILVKEFYPDLDSAAEITVEEEKMRTYKYDQTGRLVNEDVFYYTFSTSQSISHYFYNYYDNGVLRSEERYYDCVDSTTRNYSAMQKWEYNKDGMVTRFVSLGIGRKFPIWDYVSEYDDRNLLSRVIETTNGKKMTYRYEYK